jgi:hypothetical protein
MAPLQLPPSFKFCVFFQTNLLQGLIYRKLMVSLPTLFLEMLHCFCHLPHLPGSQATVVIGDLAEPNEPNKKKPKKTKWEIN